MTDKNEQAKLIRYSVSDLTNRKAVINYTFAKGGYSRSGHLELEAEDLAEIKALVTNLLICNGIEE